MVVLLWRTLICFVPEAALASDDLDFPGLSVQLLDDSYIQRRLDLISFPVLAALPPLSPHSRAPL